MSHLPLTLGEHTTASGTTETIIRIGKGGKWAFGKGTKRWEVATGEHWEEYRYGQYRFPGFDIAGRVEPARDAYIDRAALGAWIAKTVGRGTMISFAPEFHADAVRMIEAGPIEAELARVTAERDEAVALLRRWVEWHDAEPNSGMPKNGTRAFLAKIGGKL